MAGLGTYLSQLRDERGPSIEELARVTRVSSRYLEALEREDFAQLPAPLFTKGYIRAYCQALGVPADEALSRYADTVRLPAAPPALAAPTASRTDDRRRSRGTLLLSFALLVAFGVALFGVALLLQRGRPERFARPAAPVPHVEVATKPSGAPPAPAAPSSSAPEPDAAQPATPSPAAAASVPSPVASSPPASAPAPAAASTPSMP